MIIEVADVSASNVFATASFRQLGRAGVEIRPSTVPLEKLAIRVQVQTVCASYSFFLSNSETLDGWGDFMNHRGVKEMVEWVKLGRDAIAVFSFWHEEF